MLYRLEEDRLVPVQTPSALEEDQSYFCTMGFGELPNMAELLGINEKIAKECLRLGISKLDNHNGYDYMALNVPHENNLLKASQRVCIYFRPNLLVMIYNHSKVIHDIIETLEQEGMPGITLPRILYTFFDQLTYDDMILLSHLEQEVSSLEEGLITSRKVDCIKDIVHLRKQLLTLKRYYEQLYDITSLIEEDTNNLLDPHTLKHFHRLSVRVDRLFHSVLNLRDYVTEVREAYQAQVDINLNQLMKLFTVITTICLPLTLIAGWYGMNFNMPEYQSAIGYPMVLAMSIVIVVASIAYFRKNNWF